ncbi:MAG: hypothetical protein ACLFNU_10520 [Bacteroidales bacterium]
MAAPNRFIIVMVAVLIPSIVLSQQVNKKQLGFSMGLQGRYCATIPNNSHLDFLNYLDTDKFTGNYLYLNFNGNFKLSNLYYINMVVGMFSDLAPVKYNFTFSYLPWNNYGLGVSFLGYPEYINEITQFHWDNHEGMYGTTDSNYWQRRNYNMGFALGPEFKYQHKSLSLDFRVHAGLRWVKRFDTGIAQKELYGNYRRVFNYEIDNNFNLYILPELEFCVNMFSISESLVGLKFRAAGEFTKRTLNYQQTTYHWTAQNSRVDYVTLPKHPYRTLEFDFGLFVRW